MADSTRISRQDIEEKIKVLQHDISGRAQDKKQTFAAAAAIGATVVVIVAYLLGRRSGRRRGSRVEFRRF